MRKMMLPLVLLFVAIPLAASNNGTIDEIGHGTFDQKARGHLDEYAALLATHPKGVGVAIAKDLGTASITMNDHTPFVFEKRPYYSVVFVATPPGATDPKIYHILLHATASNSAEVVDHLPGITDFIEIFLSEDPDAEIDSVFSSAPVVNPLEAQAIKAEKFIEPAIGAGLSRVQEIMKVLQAPQNAARTATPTPPPPPPPPCTTIPPLTPPSTPPPITIKLRSVHIFDIRSTISVNTTVSPAVEVGRATLETAVKKTCQKLLVTPTLISNCTLADDLFRTATNDLSKIDVNGTPQPNLEPIVTATDRQVIIAHLRQVTTDDFKNVSDCMADGNAPNAEARLAAIKDTEAAFVNLFASDDKPLTSSDSFADTPLSHLDLGVAAGAMLRIRGANRAKLNDSGIVVPNPLQGLVSMAALHWHPIPFDSATVTPTSAERGSVLLGFIVSPEPGLGAGLSWSLFRGLNVHISHDWMIVHEKKDEMTLRRGWARAITVGFGYNFE